MSDILPKFKLYLLITFFAMLINVGYNIMNMVINNTFDLLGLLAGLGIAFIPFVSTISIIVTSNIPVEAMAFISIITTVISIIQTFLITMFILQTVHNIIWNPDV